MKEAGYSAGRDISMCSAHMQKNCGRCSALLVKNREQKRESPSLYFPLFGFRFLLKGKVFTAVTSIQLACLGFLGKTLAPSVSGC